MIFYGLTLLVAIFFVILIKTIVKRERPKRRSDTTRFADLRAKENGTYAMPSGDATAAAIFCCLISIEMGMPFIYILMPLVMMGRVYYQCHWLGDTIVGFMIGTFWALVGASYFTSLVPFF